jgi:hypothetical protein
VIENLTYGQLSDPLEVAAGSYDLEARLHGTGEVVLDLAGIAVEPEMVSHLILYGKPGDTDAPLTVATLSDEARAPMPATPTA